MIDIKRWGEFMFAFWKMIKAYQTVEDWTDLINTADRMMSDYPEPVFPGAVAYGRFYAAYVYIEDKQLIL